MERFIYLNNLFDIYGDLLTEKQQLYFKEYYFNNLTFQEIGEKYNISKNATFKQIKIIEEKLEEFEEKLKIFDKKNKINDIIKLENNENIKDQLRNLF